MKITYHDHRQYYITDNPSEEFVVQTLHELDGDSKREIIVYTNSCRLILSKDVSDKRYLVRYYEFDRESKFSQVHCVVDPSIEEDEDDELNRLQFIASNGEGFTAAPDEIVTQEVALEVVRHFFRHEKPLPTVVWKPFYE